ncbi:hypothetical protein GCM10027176_30650 [Actinoallomurus bryophytorum]|uniref:Integral membrane protein n=1 Tax=Actinoallomurus bryophytorum TaxID=1490222 RepID=A0A543CG35_9ACTN|nr:DUF6328 family protein [Actinoallomurus bryophytorum]TQL96079.1 hypothetical protein FB559_1599 [Actinoallomurus bryophytorum]
MEPDRGETPKQRLDRELIELLQGLRVVTTGVQFLFAFLLTLPFSNGFSRVGHAGRWVYYVSLVTAACASICFIAPAAQHRVLFHSGRKDVVVSRANRYEIMGASALTVSMSSAVAVAARGYFSSWVAGATAAGVIVLSSWAWFIQPLLTRRRARQGRLAYRPPPSPR